MWLILKVNDALLLEYTLVRPCMKRFMTYTTIAKELEFPNTLLLYDWKFHKIE